MKDEETRERYVTMTVMADCVGSGTRTIMRDGVAWKGWGGFGLGDVIEHYGRVGVVLVGWGEMKVGHCMQGMGCYCHVEAV